VTGAGIAARGICFRHAGGWSLGPVDMVAPAGTVTALIGPNGAGKTTLLRVLAGLLRPAAGEVMLDGSGEVDRERLARQVAFAPTEPAFPDGTTAADLLHLRGNLCRCDRAELEATKERLRALLGQPLTVRPSRLSRGQRLHLALGLTLLGGPRFIVADEPWSGLDPMAMEEVLSTLGERARAGAAVVVSSHDLYQLPLIATRYLFLVGGRVQVAGNLDELRNLAASPSDEPAAVLKELYRHLVKG